MQDKLTRAIKVMQGWHKLSGILGGKILRILPQQNTALLSYVCQSVSVSVCVSQA